MNAADTESHKSFNEHRFRNLAKITSHALSKVRDLDYTPKRGSLSFQESAPSTPPIYDPPKEFNMLNFKSTGKQVYICIYTYLHLFISDIIINVKT